MERFVINEAHLKNLFLGYLKEDKTDILSLQRIGGMSNCNYRITTNKGDYVLRIPGPGSDGLINRSDERVNSFLMGAKGISPTIESFEELSGIKITKFIVDAETLNPKSIKYKDNLILVADILRNAHNSDVLLNNTFDVFDEIEKYESLVRLNNLRLYPKMEDIKPQLLKLKERLQVLGVDLKPCHNDPVPENFIKDQTGRLYLIDWEYSGMNDPIFDLAALFLESNFDENSINTTLLRYFENNVPNGIKEKILIYQILIDYLWSIWTIIKEANGENFGTYGIDRFKRSLNNLNIYKSNVQQ